MRGSSLYRVVYEKKFQKQMRKLGVNESSRIQMWINANLEGCSEPRVSGRAMEGKFRGMWRYRIGDYRIMADIRDGELVILCLGVGHRKEICR